MERTSLAFMILVALIVFKYTEVFQISYLLLSGSFILWVIIVYIKIHFKNKKRNTPQPVYITSQNGK